MKQDFGFFPKSCFMTIYLLKKLFINFDSDFCVFV